MPKLYRETEEGVQKAIKEALQYKGFIVLETTHRVRRCPTCGTFPTKARYGATPGVPDLLVTCEAWPDGVWLGGEVKVPGGKFTPPPKDRPDILSQKDLAEMRRIFVWHSVDEALAAVDEAHKRWK